MAKHNASAKWQGNLKAGNGTVTLPNVGHDLAYSFNSRFTADGSGVSPEEMLGGALASCYAMALSHKLSEACHTVKSMAAAAVVSLEKVEDGFAITTIDLTVTASVPGLADAEFQKTATAVKSGCPVSKALKVPTINLHATLAG
jgi:osmotically inducible protein OsmC